MDLSLTLPPGLLYGSELMPSWALTVLPVLPLTLPRTVLDTNSLLCGQGLCS